MLCIQPVQRSKLKLFPSDLILLLLTTMADDELILVLLAAWILIGILCCILCLRPCRVSVRHVEVQSQTTFTSVRGHVTPRFQVLPEVSQGAFVV